MFRCRDGCIYSCIYCKLLDGVFGLTREGRSIGVRFSVGFVWRGLF